MEHIHKQKHQQRNIRIKKKILETSQGTSRLGPKSVSELSACRCQGKEYFKEILPTGNLNLLIFFIISQLKNENESINQL